MMTTEHQIKFKDFLSTVLCAYISVLSVNLSNRVDKITLSKSFLQNSELSCNGLYELFMSLPLVPDLKWNT